MSTYVSGAISAALLAAILTTTTAPAFAGSPYDGWRGQRAAEPAYVGHSNRRPLDGSYRYTSAPPIWAGLYAGGHLGGSWGDVTPKGLSAVPIATSGLAGGLHAGYNFQLDRFVAGFEADIDWTGVDGSALYAGGASAAPELGWLSSARMRLGYAFDNVLIYATGGFAFADLNVRTTALGITSNTSEIMTGYAIGAGIEMKLSHNISGRIEALHYGFSDERFGTSAGVLSLDTDITTVRAGLSLHLN
jgi:outer membrane immunogenic protein